MAGEIHQFLTADHTRLDALLAQALASDAIDHVAYEQFRAGLLRHIAMEDKVLFAEARARRGGDPLPITRRLRADHAAIASLLVPPPSHALLRTLGSVLDEHNPLEEGDDGFYASCEQLVGSEYPAVLARMQALPPLRISEHVDEPRIYEHIERMLAARKTGL
jgi:hypothetical protein